MGGSRACLPLFISKVSSYLHPSEPLCQHSITHTPSHFYCLFTFSLNFKISLHCIESHEGVKLMMDWDTSVKEEAFEWDVIISIDKGEW